MPLTVDIFAEPLIRDCFARLPLTFVDVGAAVGVEEPWLSLLHPEHTRVYAFEPNPENFRAIKRLPNAEYFPIAISDRRGSAKFYLYSTGSSLEDRSAEAGRALDAIEVETETLQHLRDTKRIGSIDILKTDAEKRDYQCIASAGAYLKSEVLAVQCEFAFRGEGGERPFRDYDALLNGAGFFLYALSLQRGAVAEPAGGNFLYVKSIFAVLGLADRETARTQAIKLFAIAVGTRNFNYAYAIARAAEDAGLLTNSEAAALKRLCLRKVFVPDALGHGPRRLRLANGFGILSALCGGLNWRAVSSPDPNRLDNYSILFRRPGAFARRATVETRYEAYYQEFRRSAAIQPSQLHLEGTTHR